MPRKGELIRQELLRRFPAFGGRVWVRERPDFRCNVVVTVRGVGCVYMDAGDDWAESPRVAEEFADEFEAMTEPLP